jgi:DNA-binding NtrC family response regulator
MSGPARILVADDEANLRRVLAAILTREGYEVLQAASGEEALGLLHKGLDAIVTDLKMPRIDGMTVLRRAVAEVPEVPVIIITAHGSVESAVEAVRAGAFDYIEKPFEQDQIRQIVAKAVKQSELQKGSPRPLVDPRASGESGRFGLVGQSGAMKQIYAVIEKVADTPSTVLITGESGTGKELVAKALNDNSTSRAGGPFIKINCAAIPKTLIESELFGYEKGAFTGAVASKPGRFELADKGTLFLDEIGEIPIEMQVKLLRALQESEFERVGGIKTIKVDVRLITATNRDLEKEIKSGGFREDLYYRLAVMPIQVPPLRERREDLPALCAHILTRRRPSGRDRWPVQVSATGLAKLAAYHWPGNIRELENVLARAAILCEGTEIQAEDIPLTVGQTIGAAGAGAAAGAAVPAVAIAGRTLKEIVDDATRAVERAALRDALDRAEGSPTKAARLLGISRASIYNKMKEYGITP